MSIREIDQSSVHRLTSGQVVIDLPTAVKELVENSLDAHATNIEVKFKNYGVEAFEVVDNGDGIDQENFEGIALKHHTSKLRTFSDLGSVATYGFRGEALSSLCGASSSVQVTTCTAATSPRATKLEYDMHGRIASLSKVAGTKGTSVLITRLFDGKLPVRRIDLIKNTKREFAKCISLLQAYGVIKIGVRIVVSNVLSSGKKTILFATKGNSSVGDNIINIFGTKARIDLLPISLAITIPRRASIYLPDIVPDEFAIKVVGFVSQPGPGLGRNAADRQLVYVNNRPCNLPSVIKVFNECYRTFNITQYPFVVADFEVPFDSVDVNVTPDKRTVFLHNETTILECLRERLSEFFESSGHSMPAQRSASSIQQAANISHENVDDNDEEQIPSHSTRLSSLPAISQVPNHGATRGIVTDTPGSQRNALSSFIFGSSAALHAPGSGSQAVTYVSGSDATKRRRLAVEDFRAKSKVSAASSTGAPEEMTVKLCHEVQEDYSVGAGGDSEMDVASPNSDRENDDIPLDSSHPVEEALTSETTLFNEGSALGTQSDITPISESDVPENIREEITAKAPSQHSVVLMSSPVKDYRGLTQESSMNPVNAQKYWTHRLSWTLAVSTGEIKQMQSTILGPQHSSGMITPDNALSSDLDEGEEHLQSLNISRCDFAKMSIIGQFNLGFILALRTRESKSPDCDPELKDRSDLFIIDQHASDEKFNFERLQREISIKKQPLVVPQNLSLTPLEELLVMSNLSVFESNGFVLSINESAAPGEKCSLAALPVVMSAAFGVDDFAELVHAVQESPGTFHQCSKFRKLVAMKACRSSVMIGTALKREKMRAIVDGLGALDKPWNCPHGRPTMRHLTDISKWKSWDVDQRPLGQHSYA
ncbi:hypothetical protein V1517DRAFT_318184 [Lipomyces orientalis]|uniref:Uncharacterized protein n=1 Tax=Lipomyces orientalis TaxID=1233043 RepID=A0ACC3TSN8_9ASCO